MEDVLDLYGEPYDPDGRWCALTRPPPNCWPMCEHRCPPQPGRPRRQDYAYRRAGTRNIFLTCEPLAGWRHLAITERRTMPDFAHQMRWLVDVAYPHAPVVRVVLDNLNTHRMAALYEAFPAAEARRIVKRLEFHHTPKHASWLNMAEVEFSVLTRACLQGRNPDEPGPATGPSASMSPSVTLGKPPSTGGSPPRTPRTKLQRFYPATPTLTEY